jgi:hypothetical protein
MTGSSAGLNSVEHLARHDGAYLGYLSPRAVLKCFDRPKIPTTTPYSWLMHARTVIFERIIIDYGCTSRYVMRCR